MRKVPLYSQFIVVTNIIESIYGTIYTYLVNGNRIML